MRTYSVIPLSPVGGLLEWCDGTLPIGDWLIRGKCDLEPGRVELSKSAHERYRPKDISTRMARQQVRIMLLLVLGCWCCSF